MAAISPLQTITSSNKPFVNGHKLSAPTRVQSLNMNPKRGSLTVVAAVGDVSSEGTTYLIAGAAAIALLGTAFPILFSRKDTCPECDGAGFVRKSGVTLRANAARKDQAQIVCANAKSDYDSKEEDEYMTGDEVVMSEQEKINHVHTHSIKHFDEKDDVDKWLNAEITKHMNMQGVENTEDALINIIKSIKKEMKDDIVKEQFEASTNSGIIYDVKEEYAKETGNPYSKRFDEYKRVFNNEIEHLSNEYILRIGKKGYILDDVWEKCQQNYKKTNEAWHDEGYEEDELWQNGDEKTDYDPPYVNVKTFEVKKYSFNKGRSFICITDREDEALPLGRVNGARFKAMIRKELEVNKYVHEET
ncbi:hypothetical protein Tco_0724607 [Tanacetum coccineum]